jgi:hypothetical protein
VLRANLDNVGQLQELETSLDDLKARLLPCYYLRTTLRILRYLDMPLQPTLRSLATQLLPLLWKIKNLAALPPWASVQIRERDNRNRR